MLGARRTGHLGVLAAWADAFPLPWSAPPAEVLRATMADATLEEFANRLRAEINQRKWPRVRARQMRFEFEAEAVINRRDHL
jgi:hypothetical protein